MTTVSLSAAANDNPISWVRAPQQARSQDTLARLLDAAEALLEELPWDAITVAALVQRGRSSVGAFYARFPDKDSLLQHLHARRSQEAIHAADDALSRERWRGQPIAAIVRSLVAFMTREYLMHAGFHREIIRRNSVDPRFRERSAQVSSHVCRLMANLLEERRDELAVGDALGAADMIHRIVFSVLDQHVQFFDRPPGVRVLTPDQLVEETTRACLGYLGTP
jgi:AcrR family transcriptional regulator